MFPHIYLPSQKSPTHAGFTLIELLVVIGIVAVLAAILVPVFGQVTESGKSIRCTNNLRQIGSGIYVVANEGPPVLGPGYYPPVDYQDSEYKYGTWYLLVADKMGMTNPSTDGSWTSQLNPDANIFVCPSCKTAKTKQLGAGSDSYNNLSYGYDDSSLGSKVGPDGPVYNNNVKIALMENASTTIMVADSNGDGFFDSIINNWGGKQTWPGSPHAGFTNCLFCDGHVEHVLYSRIAWGPVRSNGYEGFYVTSPNPSPTPH